MGKSCVVYGCYENTLKRSPVTFHCFPKDPERRMLWASKLGRENFVPSDTSFICSKHFTEDCFDREKFGGTWLKPKAVPSIFEFPDNSAKKPKQDRCPSVTKSASQNSEKKQKPPSVPDVLRSPSKKQKRPVKLGAAQVVRISRCDIQSTPERDKSNHYVNSPSQEKSFVVAARGISPSSGSTCHSDPETPEKSAKAITGQREALDGNSNCPGTSTQNRTTEVSTVDQRNIVCESTSSIPVEVQSVSDIVIQSTKDNQYLEPSSGSGIPIRIFSSLEKTMNILTADRNRICRGNLPTLGKVPSNAEETVRSGVSENVSTENNLCCIVPKARDEINVKDAFVPRTSLEGNEGCLLSTAPEINFESNGAQNSFSRDSVSCPQYYSNQKSTAETTVDQSRAVYECANILVKNPLSVENAKEDQSVALRGNARILLRAPPSAEGATKDQSIAFSKSSVISIGNLPSTMKENDVLNAEHRILEINLPPAVQKTVEGQNGVLNEGSSAVVRVPSSAETCAKGQSGAYSEDRRIFARIPASAVNTSMDPSGALNGDSTILSRILHPTEKRTGYQNSVFSSDSGIFARIPPSTEKTVNDQNCVFGENDRILMRIPPSTEKTVEDQNGTSSEDSRIMLRIPVPAENTTNAKASQSNALSVNPMVLARIPSEQAGEVAAGQSGSHQNPGYLNPAVTERTLANTVGQTNTVCLSQQTPQKIKQIPHRTSICQSLSTLGEICETLMDEENFLNGNAQCQNPRGLKTKINVTPKGPRKRRCHYLGDFKEGIEYSASLNERRWHLAEEKICRQRKHIDCLRKQVSRFQGKISFLMHQLEKFKRDAELNDPVKKAFEKLGPGIPSEILSRMLSGCDKSEYSPELRKFAATIHLYSPSAYRYVRRSFNNFLPHVDTLRKSVREIWAANEALERREEAHQATAVLLNSLQNEAGQPKQLLRQDETMYLIELPDQTSSGDQSVTELVQELQQNNVTQSIEHPNQEEIVYIIHLPEEGQQTGQPIAEYRQEVAQNKECPGSVPQSSVSVTNLVEPMEELKARSDGINKEPGRKRRKPSKPPQKRLSMQYEVNQEKNL